MESQRVGMTWDSLFWLLVLTAAGTVIGEYAYQQWVVPWMNGNGGNMPSNHNNHNRPVTTVSTVTPISSATPMGAYRDLKRQRQTIIHQQ